MIKCFINFLGKITKYVKIFFRFPFHLLYFLSYLSPKDGKIWIFGSGPTGDRFADNAKYFFLYVLNAFSGEIRAIWISRNRQVVKDLRRKGYEAYWGNSPKAFFYSLRAKYFIIDSFSSAFCFSYWFSGGGKKINLWHGMPIKKIGYDDDKDILYNPNWFKRIIFHIFIPWTVEKWDLTVVTSDFFKKIIAQAFRIKKERVITTGHPRNDIFFKKVKGSWMGSESSVINDLIETKKKNPQTRLFVYLPTFRKAGESFFKDTGFNIKKINQLLEVRDSFLIIKFHPSVKIKTKEVNFNRIIFLSPTIDIHPFLPYADILITDYSSIYFDFLLLDKPVIFFSYDLERYLQKDREFYFNYNEFTPGPRAHNLQDLFYWIEYFLQSKDGFKEKREKIKNICFQYKDGNSSERIFKYIKNNL